MTYLVTIFNTVGARGVQHGAQVRGVHVLELVVIQHFSMWENIQATRGSIL